MGSDRSMMMTKEDLVVRLEPPAGILEGQFGPRVVERAGMELRKHRAGDLDDLAVNVHHQRPLDRAVPEDLAERGPLPPADDHHPLRVRMHQHGGMDEHLVVDELVRLGGLDLAVEDQRPAVVAQLDDLDVLEGSLPGKQDGPYFVDMPLARPQPLMKPLGVLWGVHRRTPPSPPW